jgi:hypothetical protein
MAVAEKRREEDDKRTRGRQGEKRTRKWNQDEKYRSAELPRATLTGEDRRPSPPPPPTKSPLTNQEEKGKQRYVLCDFCGVNTER